MHLSKQSDTILVKKYIDGDEQSLAILLAKHKQRVYGFIFNKVMNQHLAEDIFQDTFIKVINTLKQGKYNEEGKFVSWVMRIAHNLIIDHFRKHNRMPKFDRTDEFDIFDVLGDDSKNRESQIIETELHTQVTSLIPMLPKDQQSVLKMRIYQELSFKEISEKTGDSINTVLGRMRYALINMRKMVAQNNIILSD